MLQVDYPYNGKTDRIRHSSDAEMMIRQDQTGFLYVEAVDVYPTEFTYTETDVPIEIPKEPDEEENS